MSHDGSISFPDTRDGGAALADTQRAREEFCRLFFDEDLPAASARGLCRYFLAFAAAARAKPGVVK